VEVFLFHGAIIKIKTMKTTYLPIMILHLSPFLEPLPLEIRCFRTKGHEFFMDDFKAKLKALQARRDVRGLVLMMN
jgi:hypothetical protein